MGEEKEILLRGKVCAYLTWRLMGDPKHASASQESSAVAAILSKETRRGEKHNQAIRALGRHLTRIIYKLLKEEREYEIRPEQGNTKTRV
jgi:hypothetical protein